MELYPVPEGWVLRGPGRHEVFGDIADAASKLEAGTDLHLALPLESVLVHRLALPTVDEQELEAMMRLQIEKLLPFSPDEITSGYLLVEQREAESVVLVFSVQNEKLDALCRPLAERGIHPSRVSVLVSHLVGGGSETKLIGYQELERLVLAIVQGGRLAYAQAVEAANGEQLLGQLPGFSLAAQLEGVTTEFAAVEIAPACFNFESTFSGFFAVPVRKLSFPETLGESSCDLVPVRWIQARKMAERSQRVRTRVKQTGVVYLALVLMAVAYLGWLHFRLQSVESKLATMRPQTEFVEKLQKRWSSLSPAIDPAQYTVEVLLQAYNCLPSEEVHLTKFTQTPEQFVIEGEAPTANLAIEYGERLKKTEGLNQYSIDMGNPVILPNEHAQFRVFGKP